MAEAAAPPQPALSANALQDIVKVARIATSSNTLDIVLQVLDVRRFLLEPTFCAATGQTNEALEVDGYDLILSDATQCIKVLLALRLNHLVTRGQIQATSVIRIKSLRYHVDETDLASKPVLVLEDAQIEARSYNTFIGLSDTVLAFPFVPGEQCEAFSPRISKRAGYMELHSDFPLADDPSWVSRRAELKCSSEDARSLLGTCELRLNDIITRHKTFKSLPPFVARITKKSHLHCIPSTNEKIKFPFQAYLELTDGTFSVTAVLWYSLCRDFYTSLHLGDVIVVTNYRLKPATRYCADFSEATVELSLNSQNPTAEIAIISSKDVPTALGLPGKASVMRFIDRSQFALVSDGHVGDVVGVIKTLSRIERGELSANRNKAPARYRWIELADHTSQHPIILKLYDCGFTANLDQMYAGMVLVCSQIKLCSIVVGHPPKRIVFATSTTNSFFSAWFHDFSIDNSTNPYRVFPAVANVLQWVASAPAVLADDNLQLGGYTSRPIPCTTVLPYNSLPPHLQQPMPFTQCIEAQGSLLAFQTISVAVQGKIVELQFVPISSAATVPVSPPWTLAAVQSNMATVKPGKRRKFGASSQGWQPSDGVLFDEGVAALPLTESSLRAYQPVRVSQKNYFGRGYWLITLVNLNNTHRIRLPLGSCGSVRDDEATPLSLLRAHLPVQLLTQQTESTPTNQAMLQLFQGLVDTRLLIVIDMYNDSVHGNELVAQRILLADQPQ